MVFSVWQMLRKIFFAHAVVLSLLFFADFFYQLPVSFSSVFLGYLIGLMTYFWFSYCFFLQKRAISAMQNLAWIYFCELSKVLVFVFLLMLAVLLPWFTTAGVVVGTSVFFVAHVFITIRVALKEARLV